MAELLNGEIPKIIAFYLPQFHEIEENNIWWGKGFTEWTNVKKAKSLFNGHQQPNIPLDDNYYNLLEKNSQEWQSKLALDYGIFGFCYYHYWFQDGKKVLEKPAEQMLKNKNIKIPFCFSWANENWTRNWDGGNREVMIEQSYGGKSDWDMHFEYLMQFFLDERYITYDKKPVFIIYKPDLIPELYSMVKYFRKKAMECGLPGLYIGYQFPSYKYDMYFKNDIFDFSIGFEPTNSRYSVTNQLQNSKLNLIRMIVPERTIEFYRKLRSKKNSNIESNDSKNSMLKIKSFDEAWNIILNQKWEYNFMPGAFCGWDNTPRNIRGLVYTGFTVDKFKDYLTRLLERAKIESKPAVFLNAWNEWGEGAYLEPDKTFGYGKLISIKRSLESLNKDK